MLKRVTPWLVALSLTGACESAGTPDPVEPAEAPLVAPVAETPGAAPEPPSETAGAALTGGASPVTASRGPRRLNPMQARELAARVRPGACDEHLQELTKAPHPAGSRANEEAGRYLEAALRGYGLKVARFDYDVLIPRPLQVVVEMTEPVAYSAPLREPAIDLDADTMTSEASIPFNAYAPDCDLEGHVLYANYGRREDFETLRKMGASIEGAIVLVRYGALYRGSKVRLAEEFGAAGVLLFSDPADDGFAKGDVYPDGPFRPSGGIERGTVLYTFLHPGDPGTPGTPSVAGAEQLTYDQMTTLPEIPVTCMSHADVEPVLRNLDGNVVPEGWQGALPFTYHVGDGSVRLSVQIQMDYKLRRITNIVATLPGLQYPDEEILVGNHRDAWMHGAVDPGSGTAVLLETARVLAESARDGLSPDRTIKFAFWDGEEYGSLGSTEFGEQFAESLGKNCVAYVNLDAVVSGPDLRITGSPSLEAAVNDALGLVPSDRGGLLLDEASGGRPFRLPPLGCGSDSAVFLDHLGIPSVDIRSSGANGIYHSLYDTYAFMKRYGDPGFRRHDTMARLTATLVMGLARSPFAPMDFIALGREARAAAEGVEAAHPQLELAEIKELATAIEQEGRRLADLRAASSRAGLADRLTVNRLLIGAERAQLTKGLPDRPWYKHALHAPDPDLGYLPMRLPALEGALRSRDRERMQEAGISIATALRTLLGRLEQARAVLERVAAER